ncbi:uncharacterized protein LOC110425413 [Herrania umbratica]|uniref:Uncharacterized protein LOC110425413 n=1 Tax=Herrania umbratica TaxID=108875 RepID=A0A6J1BA00_9ROSI|nr:uncharacterized protein LOC110425413 [Herrania umbratica]
MEQIRHFSHPHMLTLVEVGKGTDAERCVGCGSFFRGPAYTCKQCPGFFLHKSCVELPRQIKNEAFHQEHPLTLYPMDSFVCDGCGELCGGLFYRCGLCMFSLDVKCATLNQELARSKAQKGMEIKILINHFSHNHQLTRCTFLSPPGKKKKVPCMACKQNMDGKLIYSCQSCLFLIHESCLINMPEQIKSSFHPEHPLLAQPLGRGIVVECGGCSDGVYGISFSCSECNFDCHASCAKYQTRAIKHNCHVHPLLHLETSNSRRIQRSLECKECGEYCEEAFLCCKTCKFFTHLECVPLPSIVKHIRHLHLLILKNSVVQDDSNEYYCDACEEERNSNHSAYICEECNYIMHIHCVMSEVEPPEWISSYLVPRPRKEKPDKGDQITSKIDGKLLEGEGIQQGRTEKKSILDKLEAEMDQVWKQMDNLRERLRELQEKYRHVKISLDNKEGH